MLGNTEMQDPPAIVADDKEALEDTKHAQQQLRINRRPPGFAVAVFFNRCRTNSKLMCLSMSPSRWLSGI
jgi:hypothetical protein